MTIKRHTTEVLVDGKWIPVQVEHVATGPDHRPASFGCTCGGPDSCGGFKCDMGRADKGAQAAAKFAARYPEKYAALSTEAKARMHLEPARAEAEAATEAAIEKAAALRAAQRVAKATKEPDRITYTKESTYGPMPGIPPGCIIRVHNTDHRVTKSVYGDAVKPLPEVVYPDDIAGSRFRDGHGNTYGGLSKYGPDPATCETFTAGMQEFQADMREVRRMVEKTAGYTYEGVRGQMPALLVAHGRIAQKWEGGMPEPCGACVPCYRARGYCDHGWKGGPRGCPTCRGAE